MAVQMMSGFIGILQREESLVIIGVAATGSAKGNTAAGQIKSSTVPASVQLGCRQSHPNVQYDFRAEESDRWGSLRS